MNGLLWIAVVVATVALLVLIFAVLALSGRHSRTEDEDSGGSWWPPVK